MRILYTFIIGGTTPFSPQEIESLVRPPLDYPLRNYRIQITVNLDENGHYRDLLAKGYDFVAEITFVTSDTDWKPPIITGTYKLIQTQMVRDED